MFSIIFFISILLICLTIHATNFHCIIDTKPEHFIDYIIDKKPEHFIDSKSDPKQRYLTSEVSEQCKYVADAGLVCPMTMKQVDGNIKIEIITYLDAQDEVKKSCCQHLLSQWGSDNSLSSISEQDDFIRSYWSNSDALYVLLLNGKFAGCVAIDRTKFYPYFSHLYIVPEKRKKKYGQMLIEFVEAYTLQNGMSEIRIWCHPKLYQYYRKLNYNIESREENLIYMVKQL